MAIEIPILVWEMAQWEVHALRGMLHTMLLMLSVYAVEHPEAEGLEAAVCEVKQEFDLAMVAALADPRLRRKRPAA